MTLNASGPISLAGTTAGVSIEIENGGNGTTQISLNCAAVRSLAGVPSGAITMPTDFYGKANQYNYTISSNQTNFCMRAGAVSAGWNGSSKLAVTIQSGVIISSNSTGTPAMRIQGSFPAGVTVTNSGTIVGMGGNGGRGGGGCGSPVAGVAGSAGGTALKVCSAVTICNASGVIAGGGGGGGGGGRACCQCCYTAGGGGGGGGRSSNAANSSGGARGNGGSGGASSYGTAGCSGTYSSAGSGGAYGVNGGAGPPRGGTGGTGGGWGSTGSTGGSGSRGFQNSSGGAGGSGGNATCGAGTYITWTGTGTRYGSIN